MKYKDTILWVGEEIMWGFCYDRILHMSQRNCTMLLHTYHHQSDCGRKDFCVWDDVSEVVSEQRLSWMESDDSALFHQHCVYIESMEGRFVMIILPQSLRLFAEPSSLPGWCCHTRRWCRRWGCSAALFKNKMKILGSEAWLCNKAASAGSHLSHVVTFLGLLVSHHYDIWVISWWC